MAKTKRKLQVNPVIELDEIGRTVMFAIPFAGLNYGYDFVPLKQQDKIDDTTDELIELHYGINEN